MNYFCNCLYFRCKSCCKSPEDGLNDSEIRGIDIRSYLYLYIYISKVYFLVSRMYNFRKIFFRVRKMKNKKMEQLYQCFPIVLKHNIYLSTTRLNYPILQMISEEDIYSYDT
jgi:hypothetical protein